MASTQRIMTYNVLNYSGNNTSKETALRIVIGESNPDIIVVQELNDQAGFSDFLSDVLNHETANLYSSADFIDQNESNIDIALYYKTDLYSFVSTTRINTTNTWGRRDVMEFVLIHDASGVEFNVYGCHLKAGTDSADENERTSEATALRNYLNTLNPDTPFIVSGDFNIYNSGEGAFQVLTESQDDNDGQSFDPINRIGYWHNNSAYADVHTQSPRGGSYGGMDDRFDWLFVSQSILSDNDLNYITGSYTAYGNDGDHFNQAINAGSNSAVSMTVANALVDASDHLPVFMDVEFDDIVLSDSKIVISEIIPNPSQVSDSFGEWVELYNNDSITYNLQNWVIRDLDSDYHVIESSLTLSPGEYVVIGRNSDAGLNGGVDVDYAASGFLLSNTEDEVVLYNDMGNLVDEVVYSNAFPFGNGTSMYIMDMGTDNNNADNWYESTLPYGDGDYGTPGYAWDDSLSVTAPEVIPVSFTLGEPYPNPFNARIQIPFEISRIGSHSIKIYSIDGTEVESFILNRTQGNKTITWNAENMASGVYLIQLSSEYQSLVKKIVLMK